MRWTGNFPERREARVSRLDFEIKPPDLTSKAKSLGWWREKELRLEIKQTCLSGLRE